MIRTITVGGEHGSGRREISRLLAEQLGWLLLDKAVIDQIAQDAKCPPDVARQFDECVDSWMHRMQKALWRGGYEGVVASGESEPLDADAVAALSRRIVESAAAQGECVIVGRGAQCILQRRPDAFHVFVYAPRAARIKRVRQEDGPELDPETVIDSVDRVRQAYIRRHFHQDWTNRHLYDLMICSSRGDAAVVAAILGALGKGARG